MNKKILTLDNLYEFYSLQNKTCKFNAKKSGYQISVQVPAQFEINNDLGDDSLLFCKVKLMHSGENRNHSSVTDDALNKAAKTLAYKPILANFFEYTDEKTGKTLKDFTSHDMEIREDGSINYLEKQIGCFTSDEPYFEVEKETGHNFLYGYCAIPREYTDACSIIERKNGTKVSVELAVNELSFNGKTKILELTDVVIMGATCLGKNPDTLEDVGEGMLNARLDIADFSVQNNSIIQYTQKLDSMQEKLDVLLSRFDIDNSKEGGTIEVETEKNFDEVTETEQVTETEETTEEEVTVTENESEETVEETSEVEETVEETETEEAVEEVEETVSEEVQSEQFEKMVRTFEISHDDIRYALYNLLSSYEEADNEWYWISAVYDSYFVYENWEGTKVYKQSYSRLEDNVSFEGERTELYKMLVTESEKAELEAMRANYSSIQEKLAAYEYAEQFEDKMSVFADDAYGEYLETEEFKSLMSKDSVDKFSKEELQEKADAVLGRLVKTNKTFSYVEKKENDAHKVSVSLSFEEEQNKPYGNLFD